MSPQGVKNVRNLTSVLATLAFFLKRHDAKFSEPKTQLCVELFRTCDSLNSHHGSCRVVKESVARERAFGVAMTRAGREENSALVLPKISHEQAL